MHVAPCMGPRFQASTQPPLRMMYLHSTSYSCPCSCNLQIIFDLSCTCENVHWKAGLGQPPLQMMCLHSNSCSWSLRGMQMLCYLLGTPHVALQGRLWALALADGVLAYFPSRPRCCGMHCGTIMVRMQVE